MIRNKYNGYGFDGSRLYHDPISLSIAATKAGAASSAAAAAAATKAAAATAGTAAAQTAAIEAAKQAAIQQGMQQVGVQAGKTAALEASKKGVIDASMQQMAQQAGKQGIAQFADDAASLATQSGSEVARNQAIEAFKQSQLNPNRGVELGKFAGDVAPGTLPPANPLPPAGAQAGSSAYFNPASKPIPSYAAPAAPLPPAGGGAPLAFKEAATGLGNAPPELTQNFLPKGSTMRPENSTFARAASDKGIDQLTQASADKLMGMKETTFPLAPESSLAKGAREALNWMGENKLETGLGLMTVGQYMNQPKQGEEDKNKYRNTVDMSDFQPTVASVEPFTPSYEYQKYAAEGGLMKYAVGGPVETMSAMNAIGGNMQYPQAGLQTALYSNPMMQRPESVNVISPGEGPAVGAYSGEQKFASGGLSEAQRREYGLRTRGERASRNLSKTYEEMEAEREKEAMKLLGERSDPGIIPRSRTQQLSSPFSAAETEYARLAKKNKVPVVPLPKTNLGDIDTYMDIPIEAAGGGIMHGLGGYSDGGRLLRGPGDGVSDSIPAVIGKRQPARLADGEFVIPARIVSELGNGSTEAGARKLYAMMERVQNTRKKSIGKKKVAVNSKADKHLPA
jgi:hypothetical protein